MSGGGGLGQKVKIFSAAVRSSVHLIIGKKDILFLGKGPTKWLYDTKLPAEAEYSINFTEQGNTFCFKSTSRQKQQ